MGLSVCYDWKLKTDAAGATKLVRQWHRAAKSLPLDELSDLFDDQPPEFPFDGTLYVSRKRADGAEETVQIPATRAIGFFCRVEGAETVSIGLASHPPVVVHREDVIERDDTGRDVGRKLGAGDPIEFPTRRRGYWSWHACCKTQYAGNPKLGGEANFLRAHLTLIELLDRVGASGAKVRVRDDSGYAKHRDADKLLKSLRDWNGIVASFAGRLSDALGPDVSLVAPIRDRPDFEHLEAEGGDVLKKLWARQRRRKRKG